MRWYADNSDFGSDGAAVPDVFVFGGLIISEADEPALIKGVEQIKKKYGHARAPVKWNFKDVAKMYNTKERQACYAQMLDSVDKWRPEIFDLLGKSPVQIVVAAIEAYSSDKDMILKQRDDLAIIAFTNALMRFGLHVRYGKVDRAQVILDWPDGNARKPFNLEYDSAYQSGLSVQAQKYHCGPLVRLGFADSVMFTTTEYSTMLQVTDLVVGATKEFLRCCLNKTEQGRGLSMLARVRDQFRGAPNPTEVLSRGITISSGNKGFRDCVGTALKEQLYA